MAMPLNRMIGAAALADFVLPDDVARVNLLADLERGGTAIGDPSDGLDVQDWEGRLSGTNIQVKPVSGSTWTTVTSDTDISELAIAFDQNMRPSVAYVAGGTAKLYWYDATAAAYVTTSFVGATSPVVTMDDKRERQVGLNDVLLFYLRDGRVWHRRQRDRYTIEYNIGPIPDNTDRIVQWGMGVNKRIQLKFDLWEVL